MVVNYFDINRDALMQKKFLTTKLEEQAKNDDDTSFKYMEAKDGNLCLKYIGDKELFFESAYRPREEAKRWAERYNSGEKNKITVLFGIGSGYRLECLMEDLTENDIIIVYEPSISIFVNLLKKRDITHIINNAQVILVIEAVNDDQFRRFLAIQVKWFNLERTRLIEAPQYAEMFSDIHLRLLEDFRKEVSAQIGNTVTLIARAKDRIGNIICNLQQVKRCNVVNELVDKVDKSIPFIVVSAGPSLTNNIHLLKEAKDRAFICATDTGAKVMLQHGIIPDLFVCVDPLKFDVLRFEDERLWEIPVVCSLTSHYKLLRNAKSKIILFSDGHDILYQIYKKKNQMFSAIASGGSVAHNAFALGRFLNFKRIILVGQDLAFTGNKTHMEGSFDDISISQREKEHELYVEDIYGDKVLTRFDFKAYLNWFEREIKALENEVEVIDATEGGAKIAGTQIMTLREVIDTYCTKEEMVSEIIKGLDPLFSEEEYGLIDEEIKKLKVRIKTLAKKAQKAKVANKKRYDFYKKKLFGNPKFRKTEDELEKLDHFIDNSKDLELIDDLISGAEYIMVKESAGLAENDPDAIKKRVENKNTLYDQINIAVNRVLATFDSVESGEYFREEDNYGVLSQEKIKEYEG